MKKILLLCLFTLSFKLFSADLDCSIRQNLDSISEIKLSTVIDQKSSIDSISDIDAYVTEKAGGHCIIEAYLADAEMRIFAEGSLLVSGDKLIASSWSRARIVELECRLSKKP